MLAQERVAAPGDESGGRGGTIWFLHGIYGSRQNWRGVARRLVSRRPDWAARLLDLRMHGESQGLAPPHDLDACAGDLLRLAAHVGEMPTTVVGHSFGGKVALVYACRRPADLRQLWVVDASPSSGRPSEEVSGILEHLRSLPGPFAARGEAVRALVARGISEPVARWLVLNLVRDGASYGWRLDLDAVESLLLDFHATDLWSAVSSPPPGCEIRFVKATRSDAVTEEDGRRIEDLAARGLPLRLHRLEGGHWLNAESPEELTALLADGLP